MLLSQQPWLNIPLLKYDVGGEAVLQPVAQLSNVLTRWHQWPASSPAAGLFLRTGLKCIPLHEVESWGTRKFKLCEHYSGMGDVGFEQHGLQAWLVLNIANYFTTVGSHKLTEEKYDTFSLSFELSKHRRSGLHERQLETPLILLQFSEEVLRTTFKTTGLQTVSQQGRLRVVSGFSNLLKTSIWSDKQHSGAVTLSSQHYPHCMRAKDRESPVCQPGTPPFISSTCKTHSHCHSCKVC